eukprot:5358156-Prymnesium_polylepis.1
MPTPRLQFAAAAATATAAAAFCIYNHRRIRRTKSCMHAVKLFPADDAPERPFPLVFVAGTAQKADVWRGRMEMLRAAGYECHALEFVQSGRYVTSYAEQMRRIRHYITERLDARPVLIGHSQGGTKIQQYLLADGGDASVASEHSVRAVVLLASSGLSLLEATPTLFGRLVAASGLGRTVIAYLLGLLYLEKTAFLFGGGPWRHTLGMRGLFNARTSRTTLTSAHGPSDARDGRDGPPLTPVVTVASDGSLSIADWLDTYLCDHDPFVADAGVLRRARTPERALAQNGCELLHLVGSEDALIPKEMSTAIATTWG